jgi:hypothetical protein
MMASKLPQSVQAHQPAFELQPDIQAQSKLASLRCARWCGTLASGGRAELLVHAAK